MLIKFILRNLKLHIEKNEDDLSYKILPVKMAQQLIAVRHFKRDCNKFCVN